MADFQDIDRPSPLPRQGVLLLILGLSGLCTATWPLWIGGSDLPRIPWFSILSTTPRWVDFAFLALTALGLLAASGLKEQKYLAIGLATLGWGGLLLLDQQRVQTWAWQFWLLLLVYIVSRAADLLTVWRWLVIAIYFWSAFSKFDRGFTDGHGQLLLEGLVNSIGQSTKFWSPTARQGAALLLPLAELSIGVLLTFRRTRHWGWGGSIAMHSGLLLTLGMNGLGHEWGVLCWNIWFMAQNSLLWSSESPATTGLSKVGKILAFTIFTYPALQFIGMCDHWPAWEVYCARPELVRLLVAPEQIANLPNSLQPFVLPPEPLQDFQAVRIEGWGFEQVRSPFYPQERYRLALISSVIADFPDGGWKIEIASSPNRFTGERKHITLLTREDLQRRLAMFLVNTRPRVDD